MQSQRKRQQEPRRVPKSARQFLAALDPDAEEFTFQTFDDDEKRKDVRLAGHMHGSLDALAPKLFELQDRAAGVFVMVNAGDGQGRSEKNVTRIRAVFADCDGQVMLDELIEYDPKPHIIVESSTGHYQPYWLVKTCRWRSSRG